jgi:ParB-like chromosome segregation protein Spo0J
VKSRCDPFWVSQVRADVEHRVEPDRDHVAHRHLSGPRVWPRGGVVHDVQHPASAVLRVGVRGAGAARTATILGSAVPAEPTRSANARDAPAALPRAAKESDASVGSDLRNRGEGGADDNAEDRVRDAMRTLRKERCRRRKRMTETTALRDEVAIGQLDQRYANLRLASPEELGRVRTSVERMGILSPVLVATAVEATQVVLVDGFKRVRIATDRGDPMVWVKRAALDAPGAKVAMIATNVGHSGLRDLEEAWIVRSLCRDHGLTQVEVGKALRRDKSWVCRRLMLAERLEGVLQDDIRLGLLSSSVARELVRLPRGNQIRMAATIRAHELTSKQAHRIVTELLRTTDPAARDEVLGDPLRYLGAIELPTTIAEDPRLGKGGNDVRRSLLQVGGAAERLARTVVRHAPMGLVGDDARILGPLVARTLRTSHEATALLEQLATNSGTR